MAWAAFQPAAARRPGGAAPFSDRVRALFYARVTFLAVGLAVLAVPAWSAFVGTTGFVPFVVYFGVVAYAVISVLLADHPRIGRPVTFATLVLDLVVLTAMVLPSGGLKSPLMAGHIVLTVFFILLFPQPLTVLAPLTMLAVVSGLNLSVPGPAGGAQDLFVLVWYATLCLIVAYVMWHLRRRDEARSNELWRLSKGQERAVIGEERLRLSREIHDGLGACLSSLIIQSEYIHRLTTDARLRREIAELKNQAEEAIEELRRSLTMMRRDFDLHAALAEHTQRFVDRTGVGGEFKVRGRGRRMPSEMQLAIFRLLQESLANVHKHAQAGRVDVRLTYDADRVALTVSDDGVGFDGDARPRRGHYGLANMHERAKRFRGAVEVQSAEGEGTTVHTTLIIPSEGSHVAPMPERSG